MTAKRTALVCLLTSVACAVAASAADCIFPPNQNVKNVKTAFGAVGDGKADDTKALQEAVYDNCSGHGIVYLPNGTYRITGQITFATRDRKRMSLGPWMFGQNRDSVVIRLDDGATGFQDTANPRPLIACTYHMSGEGISADMFMRIMRNLTIDAGKNPGAVGLRYYSNNVGTLENVKITGTGAAGLDLAWVNMNGPCLIRDVTIRGFGVGIRAGWAINSQTLCNVTIDRCRTYGILHGGQVLTCENLRITNTPCAIISWHPGVLTVINSTFTGGDRTKPAIEDNGRMFVRNVTTQGFAAGLKSDSARGSKVLGATIAEYVTNGVRRGFDASATRSLNLPIKAPPYPAWETDPGRWICVNDFGAAPGDTIDDTKAFQRAIDSAAATGKTTVCINPGRSAEPNWYLLSDTVFVHGSVRHIIGLGFARICKGGFALRKDAAPVVLFENLYSFGAWSRFLVKDAQQTLIVRSCDGFDVTIRSPGDAFLDDCCLILRMAHPKARIWARQLDMESQDITNADNNGGTLWVLGLKTERNGIKVRTAAGGRTEVLGGHLYALSEVKTTPMFLIDNAQASFSSICEIRSANPYPQQVREIRGDQTRDYVSEDGHWPLYVGYGKTAK